MKFLKVSSALSVVARLVPGTLCNSPATNKLACGYATNWGGLIDETFEYQSTDGLGEVQFTQSNLHVGPDFQTFSLSFADMDGDGHPDLLRGGTEGLVYFTLNDGSDNFPASGETVLSSYNGPGANWHESIHGVDLDNDGYMDVVTTTRGEGSWLFKNNGGTFGAGVNFSGPGPRASSTYRSALADINGDGYPDYIVGSDSFNAQVFLNNGSGGFDSPYDLTTQTASRAICACDFNQDGNMDLVVSFGQGKNNPVYMNDGSDPPVFAVTDLPDSLGNSVGNACADLNGDGYPDVIVSDYSGDTYVYLNQGATNPGNFPTNLKANLYTTPITGWHVILGDFDGDGDIDVHGGYKYLSLNDGNGNFGSPTVIGRDGCLSAMLYSASQSAETPSPTTATPSKTPTASPQTASPTNSPTGSPTEGPLSSATAGGAGGAAGGSAASSSASGAASPSSSAAADSLYYPDWTKSNGGCKTGGGQPLYMTLDHSNWMLATLNDCCVRYFGWMLNECKGTSGGAPSGLWYPDWAGQDGTCKNDGSEPQYMALNPGAWMHSSKQACCEANFGWMLNGCLDSSGPNAGATGKWFMVWDGYKCKRDCAVGTGPSCGGRAESWDELFDTRSACCSDKAAWNPTDCLVD